MGDRLMGEVVHIAGPVIQVGSHKRQRCSWCGEVLEDFDLSRVGAPVEYDEDGDPIPWQGPAMWEPGALVARDGHMTWTVEPVEEDGGVHLPDSACAKLPPELTGNLD